MDYDISQKDRKLQENRKTIETQRKAIQELQRMVVAFENLRLQAEADQLEMLKAKEGLKQFEDLKVRFDNEYHTKEKKVKLHEIEGQLSEALKKESESSNKIESLQKDLNKYKKQLEVLNAKIEEQRQENENIQELLKESAPGSAVYKSPGAALKLAAMKRMRDAGWTTITNSDKKKKKFTEKIFA
ncbi:synaptonemal complex protein 1 [Silurus asotus]|uniref:Synaptonemal complex protein 1 n=1 Tax=Silurus asotus TaxID=30991 RepID=A0AAD5B630_SILAS|nr:synaptonemal complex protein 1 [Silurus asotus]